MASNEEISDCVRPLLRLSREHIERAQKLEYALVSSLERDPLLKERLRRLRTVPGVGPITALTWALEIGDVTRFRSIKEAISYCGLCGDENSSADKVMRMPLSKQRTSTSNGCWWKPLSLPPESATNWQWSGSENCREEIPTGPHSPWRGKWSAIYWRSSAGIEISCLPRSSLVLRQPKTLPKKGKNIRIFRAQTARSCRLPTERRSSHSRGSLRIVSGLAENTNSIFGDSSSELETANGCLVLQGSRNP
jgi:hypothetical protein